VAYVLLDIYFAIGLLNAALYLVLMTSDRVLQASEDPTFQAFLIAQRLQYELLPLEERATRIVRIVSLWPILPFLEQR
jgi:hypothetical protein